MLKKIIFSLFVTIGSISQSFGVATDDNRSNTIASLAASSGSAYLTTQAALLDSACLYGVLNMPDPNSATGKMIYALALSAYTQSLPLTRIMYDRNTSTNACTIIIMSM